MPQRNVNDPNRLLEIQKGVEAALGGLRYGLIVMLPIPDRPGYEESIYLSNIDKEELAALMEEYVNRWKDSHEQISNPN